MSHYYTMKVATKKIQTWNKGVAVASFTVDVVLYANFRVVGERYNLLENDTYWSWTLADTTVSALENQIRT